MQVQNNKIRVLHIIAPVKFGGGESVLLDLLSFTSPEIQLDLLLLCRSIEFEKKLADNNINFRVMNFSGISQNSKPMIFFFLLVRLVFSKAIFPFKADYNVLHFHGFPAVFIGFIQSFYSKKTKLIYTHHQQVFDTSNLLLKNLFNLFYNRFHILTFVSDSIMENFKKKFSIIKKCVRIYNPVADIFFQEKVSLNKSPKIRLVYPARFSTQKAHFNLIKLFALKSNKEVNYEIHFFGAGELKSKCFDFVVKNKLEHIFFFHDLISQDKLAKEFLDFDLSIFPSFYEGFGVAVAESIASQIPVIYNIQNETLHEVVSNCGWPLELEDMPDFLEKLTPSLIKEKKLNCKSHSESFNSLVINQIYHNLYKNLTNC